MGTVELGATLSPELTGPAGPGRRAAVATAWSLAAALPLIGLVSLLLRSHARPALGQPPGPLPPLPERRRPSTSSWPTRPARPRERRGDARVLLDLARLPGHRRVPRAARHRHATGSSSRRARGLQGGDPGRAARRRAVRRRVGVRRPPARLGAAGHAPPAGAPRAASSSRWSLWFAWTVADLPPLSRPGSEGASGTLLAVLAGLGMVIYAAAALRYFRVYRGSWACSPRASSPASSCSPRR